MRVQTSPLFQGRLPVLCEYKHLGFFRVHKRYLYNEWMTYITDYTQHTVIKDLPEDCLYWCAPVRLEQK